MRVHRSTLVRCLALIAASVMPAVAQDFSTGVRRSPFVEIGLDPAVVITLPIGRATMIRGSVPCSEEFAGVTSVNLGLLGWGTYVFSPELAEQSGLHIRGIRFSAGYDDISSDFEAPQGTFEALDTVNGRYTTLTTQYRTGFDLRYLRAAVELEMVIGENLFLRVGPTLNFPLSGTSTETEEIISPSHATFADQTQERTIFEGTGDLTDLGLRVGAAGTIAYRLPLGRKLFFEPSFGVDLGFTQIQPDWAPFVMRAGINFGYALLPSAPPPPPPPPPVVENPPPPREVPFTAQVDVRVVADRLPIELRRQVVARYVPVVPVAFFEQGASTFADRYTRLDPAATSSFDENLLPPNAEQSHYQVLNLLGSRLRRTPAARVTLTGTTSEDEESRPALARARAESVAAYLNSVWGIDRGRITVKSRLAPAVPSNSQYPEGRAENRRVEIELSDDDLYKPVQLRTVEPVTEPREIEFAASVQDNSVSVAGWSLNVRNGRAPFKTLTGSGRPPTRIEWNLSQEDRESLLTSGDGSTYELSVRDSVDRTVTSMSKNLPLRLDTTVTVTTSPNQPDNTAEFLLITFDFDRADLTQRGREELKSILGRIGPRSTVNIVGYTDRLGDAARNKALAEERAKRVADLMPRGTSVKYSGAGADEAPYSNNAPEGRFLNRTVRVTITDPK